MIGFILPFKPRKESRNWRSDNELLENTVFSLLQQTNSAFKIYIVFTDPPEIEIKDQKVNFIRFPHKFLEFEEVDRANPHKFVPNSQRLVERRFDKGKKTIYGCQFAKEDGCEYLMSVDSDDLVSNRLVEFIEKNKNNNSVPGWYIKKGYVLNSTNGKIYRQYKMHLFNGSTHILRSDLIRIPDFNSMDYQNYNWFVAHGWLKHRVKDQLNLDLHCIPFYGVIYIAHHSNISSILAIVEKKRIRSIAKRLLYRTKLSNAIREEFGYRG